MGWLTGLLSQYGHSNTLFARGLIAVAALWTVVTIVRWRRDGIRAALARSMPEALAGVSLVGIWAFTVAPLARYLPGDIPQHMPINLVPVLPLLAGFGSAEGWRENLPNLIGNLAPYAPLGFGLVWRFGLRVWQVAVVAASVSVAVEVSQALSDQMRSADVNDVILNAAGAVLGACAFQVARATWSASASGSKWSSCGSSTGSTGKRWPGEAPPDGLEPPTRTLGRCRSIH